MIERIIRSCVKDYENTTNKTVREQYSIVGGIIGIICNLFLFVAKFIVGMLSNSVAILSDAFNNLTDMGSSIISIIGAKLSNRPPDKDHPFGYGRFEYLATLTIAIIILIVGYKLCETSVDKFFHPEELEFSLWTIVILLGSMAVKYWMCLYNRYIAKKIDSSVNEATASDSLNDVIATAGVLAATFAQQFTTLPVDAAAGTAIGLMIMYAGYGIAKDIINILLGKAPSQELIDEIVQCALHCQYVVGIHDIHIHDYGPGRIFASFHAEVPDTSDVVEVHAALDVLEDELYEKFQMEVNIHMDPLCTNQKIIDHIRHVLDGIIQQNYPQYHTSHLRITAGQLRLNVICDIHIPPAEYSEENIIKIRKKINAAMQQYDNTYRVVLAKIMPDHP
ncbi:MAG: cation diffusion facilitator family transporter [Megasphaera sp.]|jgi:cation diffusion facilitator family transporter|nr:cation diffusion facilitator family transporter [Megasphaera sp.]MCI1248557.1 cation diffusion facilitator family transporter [Megasphaera sp.]